MEPISLAFGTGSVTLVPQPGEDLTVFLPNEPKPISNPVEAVREALRHPTGSVGLATLLRVKKPRTVVVVVNDETRPTPYAEIFPPMLEAFAEAGIRDEQVTFVVASGVHEPHSAELNAKVFGREMTERFTFVAHDADHSEMSDLGTLPSGCHLRINSQVVEADFLITIGVVMPHYFAGYSGGRKSIFPGVCSRKTIEKNHARMVEIMDDLPPIRQNPVSLEMIDVARMVGVNFIINCVVTDDASIVSVHAGDLERAWYEAVESAARLYEVPFERQADLCIVSASGYPRDVNVYQSQKGLDHADKITRNGGTIVLVAECSKGLGEDVFEEYLNMGLGPQQMMDKILGNFVIGAHKAYGYAKVAAIKKFHMLTALDASVARKFYATKIDDVQAFHDQFLRENPGAHVVVLPQGGVTSPHPAHK